jgi:hypothetical protein
VTRDRTGARQRADQRDAPAADEEAAAKLKAVIREGRELLKDLRAERRRIEELTASVKTLTRDSVGALIEAAVTEQVAELSTATRKYTDQAHDRVIAEFDRLAAILTGKDTPDQPSMEEIVSDPRVQATVRARQGNA